MTTPDEDVKRFEDFIEAMTDTEYEEWYDEDATDKQQDLADTIREQVTDNEGDNIMKGFFFTQRREPTIAEKFREARKHSYR